MIICSCHALSDHDVHQAIADVGHQALSAEQVHPCFGCQIKCGQCVGTIRRIIDEASRPDSLSNWYDNQSPELCVTSGDFADATV